MNAYEGGKFMNTKKPLPDLAQSLEALQEIEKKYDEGTRIAQTRQALEKNESIAQNKDLVTGHIYFDEHRNVMKPFPFGVYLQRKLISAPIQLKPISAGTATAPGPGHARPFQSEDRRRTRY